jgi:hypothetical protein
MAGTGILPSASMPLKKVAETVRRHQPLLLSWFKAHGELPGGAVACGEPGDLRTRRALITVSMVDLAAP